MQTEISYYRFINKNYKFVYFSIPDVLKCTAVYRTAESNCPHHRKMTNERNLGSEVNKYHLEIVKHAVDGKKYQNSFLD